ncbi:hypothetical protein DSECCO2_630120 [anaerobic digester metagenome]
MGRDFGEHAAHGVHLARGVGQRNARGEEGALPAVEGQANLVFIRLLRKDGFPRRDLEACKGFLPARFGHVSAEQRLPGFAVHPLERPVDEQEAEIEVHHENACYGVFEDAVEASGIEGRRRGVEDADDALGRGVVRAEGRAGGMVRGPGTFVAPQGAVRARRVAAVEDRMAGSGLIVPSGAGGRVAAQKAARRVEDGDALRQRLDQRPRRLVRQDMPALTGERYGQPDW